MKLDKDYLDESTIEEIEAYGEYVIQYAKVVHILDQIQNNSNYYLSVSNRRLLEEWLRNYDKSMKYVV